MWFPFSALLATLFFVDIQPVQAFPTPGIPNTLDADGAAGDPPSTPRGASRPQTDVSPFTRMADVLSPLRMAEAERRAQGVVTTRPIYEVDFYNLFVHTDNDCKTFFLEKERERVIVNRKLWNPEDRFIRLVDGERVLTTNRKRMEDGLAPIAYRASEILAELLTRDPNTLSRDELEHVLYIQRKLALEFHHPIRDEEHGFVPLPRIMHMGRHDRYFILDLDSGEVIERGVPKEALAERIQTAKEQRGTDNIRGYGNALHPNYPGGTLVDRQEYNRLRPEMWKELASIKRTPSETHVGKKRTYSETEEDEENLDKENVPCNVDPLEPPKKKAKRQLDVSDDEELPVTATRRYPLISKRE